MTLTEKLDTALSDMPVVAIIRGVEPEYALDIAHAIHSAGIHIIEVPLNSPKPFKSIERLSDALGEQCIIGCGTLLNVDDAEKVANAGGQIAVTPNTDPTVIKRTIELGMIPMPGWATPTEAFAAYAAGARYLKLFPGSTYGSGHVKAVRAVLPSDAKILAVGGAGTNNAAQWLAAGVDGFGIGSDIYKAGRNAEDVHQRCVDIVNAINAVR